MTSHQKISDSVCEYVYDSAYAYVYNSVNNDVSSDVWNSVFRYVSDAATKPWLDNSVINAIDNKLKTYDFTTKNE
jgi:hypothetical protein